MSLWHTLWQHITSKPLTFEQIVLEAYVQAIADGELGERDPEMIVQRRIEWIEWMRDDG